MWVLNNNLIYTQHPQYQNSKLPLQSIIPIFVTWYSDHGRDNKNYCLMRLPKPSKIIVQKNIQMLIQNWLQPIVKVVGALLRYLYNDAILFSDVTIDLMTIADKYNLKALFNRCDFYIAQALRSCQLTGEDKWVLITILFSLASKPFKIWFISLSFWATIVI